MSELTELPGIGPVVAEQLTAVGITTAAQLRTIGAKQALLMIRGERDPGACLHMLLALQGAIEGVPKKLLSPKTKAELNEFFKSLKDED